MIIGIDLGTTFSLASYFDGKSAKLIPNATGSYLTPSQVHFHKSDQDKIAVGDRPHGGDYGHSFARFKDNMGSTTQYQSPHGQVSPTFLSAMVLKQLKQDAETHLNTPITEAVISVPAYFNDNQRIATRLAGQMAGLATTRLINEPSAAALAYQFGFDEASLLVIDFGGGTLDVSVVDCFDNIIEIVAIGGNTQLGGNQVDRLIADYLRDNHGINPHPETLEQELITLKETLSQQPFLLYAHQGKDIAISQANLIPTLRKEIFRPIADIIKQALADSNKKKEDIDHLILVGGSSKLMGFSHFLEELTQRTPINYLNPQTVVALGMGYYSGIKSRDPSLSQYILTDVCPYTLGVATVEHRNDENPSIFPLIPRNTTVPATATASFSTIHHNQEEISIDVYQGEDYLAKDNLCLANVRVPVPPKQAKEERVSVCFTYDLNGILQVEVKGSAGVFTHEIVSDQAQNLSQDQLQSLSDQLQRYKIYHKNQVDSALLRRANAFYPSLGRTEQKIIHKSLVFCKEADESQDRIQIRKAHRKLEFILDMLDQWQNDQEDSRSFPQYLLSQANETFSQDDLDFQDKD